MEEKIIKILSLTTKLTQEYLSENKTAEKLWDSFAMLEIIIALEDEFDIAFVQDEILQMKTVANICAIVKGKINEA